MGQEERWRFNNYTGDCGAGIYMVGNPCAGIRWRQYPIERHLHHAACSLVYVLLCAVDGPCACVMLELLCCVAGREHPKHHLDAPVSAWSERGLRVTYGSHWTAIVGHDGAGSLSAVHSRTCGSQWADTVGIRDRSSNGTAATCDTGCCHSPRSLPSRKAPAPVHRMHHRHFRQSCWASMCTRCSMTVCERITIVTRRDQLTAPSAAPQIRVSRQ